MLFLEECSLLKIQDILPFFPDFVTIDHFKVICPTSSCALSDSNRVCCSVFWQDAICSSLTDYNAHIDDLKIEMKGATDSAKNIRSDIQEIRHKYIIAAGCLGYNVTFMFTTALPRCVVIQSDSRCQICEGRLLSQAFYMFPCHHAFHKDCLIQEVCVCHWVWDVQKLCVFVWVLQSCMLAVWLFRSVLTCPRETRPCWLRYRPSSPHKQWAASRKWLDCPGARGMKTG